MNDPSQGGSGEAGDSTAESAAVRVPRPWWIPPFLGRVPLGLDSRYVSLVGIVSLAALFENYDVSMLSAALKQIRESFDLNQAEMTSLLAWVRLGAIPAFFFLPLADRIGRRSVFLMAIVGMSVGTVISGFAQTPLQFIIAQTMTRPFIVAATVTAVVIVAEELPAENRGWGIGMLGAIGASGFGLGALVYAFVESLPYGWRALYMVGGVPLLLLPLFRRLTPETARFRQQQAEAATADVVRGFAAPLVELFREYPFRCIAVAVMALSFASGTSPAFGLLSDFVQTTHGWAPSSYSIMALIAGGAGIIGNPVMGWAADRIGRRPVAMLAFGLFPLAAAGIYFGPGQAIPFVWVPFVFILTGGNVLMRIVASELFPTSSRNTAMGWETMNETLGAAVGYALVGAMAVSATSIGPSAVVVSALTVLGLGIFWMLPETAGQELEATSDLRRGDDAHG